MMWIAKGGQKMLVDPGTLPYWESLGWQVDADANAVGDLTQQSAAYTSVSNVPIRGVGDRFRNVTILTYHAVVLGTFQTDCDYYQEWNYSTVTFDDIWNHLQGTATLPAKPLLITFDDGLTSQPSAFTELASRGMKGTWFVCDGYIDGTITQGGGGFAEAAATWAQVVTAKGQGHDIQSHTNSHTNMTTLSAAQVAAEFATSKARIEAQVTGQTVSHLAYPYGAWNATVTAALAGAGCKLARVVRYASGGTAGDGTGRYAIASTMHPNLALPTAGVGFTDIYQPNCYRLVDPDPELIADYGFEAGAKGWSLGSGFSVDSTPANAHSGNKSLTCVQQTSTVSSSVLRPVPVGAYSRTAVTGWIRSTMASGQQAKLQLQLLKSDGTTVVSTTDVAVLTGPAGWTQFTATVTGTLSDHFVKMYCWVQGNGSPSGAAWFDDISVRRDPMPVPFGGAI